MAPYFETAKSFADIPISDQGVDTAFFLEASNDFINMFDLIGSNIFSFVQNDLKSNLAGVTSRFQTNARVSSTLEGLVVAEIQDGQRHATACLVRLIRGLAFTCKALQTMQRDPSLELHVCFKISYDSVLRHHHTFVVRSIILVAIRAVPHRKDFYIRIAQGGSIDKLDAELSRWLGGLEIIVNRMKAFLEERGYGRV